MKNTIELRKAFQIVKKACDAFLKAHAGAEHRDKASMLAFEYLDHSFNVSLHALGATGPLNANVSVFHDGGDIVVRDMNSARVPPPNDWDIVTFDTEFRVKTAREAADIVLELCRSEVSSRVSALNKDLRRFVGHMETLEEAIDKRR